MDINPLPDLHHGTPVLRVPGYGPVRLLPYGVGSHPVYVNVNLMNPAGDVATLGYYHVQAGQRPYPIDDAEWWGRLKTGDWCWVRLLLPKAGNSDQDLNGLFWDV